MRSPRKMLTLQVFGAVAVGLGLGPAPLRAQDGQPPTGPPVTNPRTNSSLPQTGGATTPNTTVPGGGTGTPAAPRTTADILPGIPETARDPAPPGTRGVRVDVRARIPRPPGRSRPPPRS